MSDVFEQALLNNYSITITERMMSSKASSKNCNPTHAATKGIRGATVASLGPFIETTQAGKKHETKQAIVRSFFRCNPTPVRIKVVDNDDEPLCININSATASGVIATATVQVNPVPAIMPTNPVPVPTMPTNPVLATLPTILPPGGVPVIP
jgi:hypothetical protein